MVFKSSDKNNNIKNRHCQKTTALTRTEKIMMIKKISMELQLQFHELSKIKIRNQNKE